MNTISIKDMYYDSLSFMTEEDLRNYTFESNLGFDRDTDIDTLKETFKLETGKTVNIIKEDEIYNVEVNNEILSIQTPKSVLSFVLYNHIGVEKGTPYKILEG